MKLYRTTSEEEREKEILNAKHIKLSIDGVQIPHPNNIKLNWITGSEYLPSIVLKTIDEYVYSMWVCIHDDGSILTGECGCVAGLILSCKHVFAILTYIENEVTLGHSKTCTSKKQKWDVRVYRKSEKIHPPTKIGNVSLAKPHPEYEYYKIPRCLSRKRSRFDPRSPHDSDVGLLFCQKDWEELAKANGAACIFRFIPTTFSSTSVTTLMTSWSSNIWDIVSNLNLHVIFYEQLSKHRDNKIIKEIY